MYKNEKQISEICYKEDRVKLIKEWLRISFFILSTVVIMLMVIFAGTAKDQSIGDQRMAVIKIIVTLLTFALLIIAGYFYDRFLSKKMDKLWEEKKALF